MKLLRGGEYDMKGPDKKGLLMAIKHKARYILIFPVNEDVCL